MRRLALFAIVSAALLPVGSAGVASEKAASPTYVGVKKCKACHKDKYQAWSKTKLASAFDVLSDEEKKKPECIKCHITGILPNGTVLEGIQCEACHGPGSGYKSIKIMSKKKWAADPEAHKKMAIEAGLIYPKAEDCQRCHTKEGNPHFKPFDFEKRKLEVHSKAVDTTAAAKSVDTTGGK